MVHEWQIRASETVMARIVDALTTCSRETESWSAPGSSARFAGTGDRRQSVLSNLEIAERLNLSEVMEEADLAHIFGKPSP